MTEVYNDDYVQILQGHVLDVLAQLPAESVQCCVTSPPYWGLRKYSGEQEITWGDNHCEHEWEEGGLPNECYGTPGRGKQATHGNYNTSWRGPCLKCGTWRGAYGLEPTPDLYVQHTIEILRAIRRVLREDGTVYWNIGDSYAGSGKGYGSDHGKAVFTDEHIVKTDNG